MFKNVKTKALVALGASVALAGALALSACGSASSESCYDNETTIRIAASPTPHAQILNDVVVPQLEEQGYTIKDIRPSEDGKEFCVLIVNNKGEEQTVVVSKGELEAETLSVGDVVYLDEDGSLEQAYNDEDE